jgi:hypothetical protein
MSQVQYIGSGVVSGSIVGTGQTIDGKTVPLTGVKNIITVPLGTVPGVYLLKVDVAGFDSATPGGVAYFVTGAARTTGAASVEIIPEACDEFEENPPTYGLCDVHIKCDGAGNNLLIEVTGTLGKTIDWIAVLTYTFGS